MEQPLDLKWKVKWGAIALLADLLSLIPFVGDAVGPVYWIVLTFEMHGKGYSWKNPKSLVTKIVSTVGEVIPVVQELPFIFTGFLALMGFLKVQSKLGPAAAVVGGQALNHNGVRLPEGMQKKPLNMEGNRPPETEQTEHQTEESDKIGRAHV